MPHFLRVFLYVYYLMTSQLRNACMQGSKVRRKEPLPDIDLPTTSVKTILYKLASEVKDVELDEVCNCYLVG